MVDFSEIPVIKQHIELYRTDPGKAHMWDSTRAGGPGPTLLLTTTGMLSHPLWYLNLEANPECALLVGPTAVSARARVAEGAERERLWQQMAKLYPPYDQYQERAGARTIPVVVLDPMD